MDFAHEEFDRIPDLPSSVEFIDPDPDPVLSEPEDFEDPELRSEEETIDECKDDEDIEEKTIVITD